LTPPSNLNAAAVSPSQINLAWDDNSSNETGFKVERKGGATGTYAQIAAVDAGVQSYSNITGLTASTLYYYRVRANNSINLTLDSAYSNEATATTLSSPPPLPTLKSPVSGATTTNLTPGLEWNASLNATSYGLQVATSSTFATIVLDKTGLTGTQYTLDLTEALNPLTTYYWYVNARKADSGASKWSEYRSFKTPAGP
jgi:hypothetical protein